MFSFLLLTRGIGNILSAPISTALQRVKLVVTNSVSDPPKTGFAVASGQYNAMIVYAGTCFAGAAVVAMIGWSLDRRRV